MAGLGVVLGEAAQQVGGLLVLGGAQDGVEARLAQAGGVQEVGGQATLGHADHVFEDVGRTAEALHAQLAGQPGLELGGRLVDGAVQLDVEERDGGGGVVGQGAAGTRAGAAHGAFDAVDAAVARRGELHLDPRLRCAVAHEAHLRAVRHEAEEAVADGLQQGGLAGAIGSDDGGEAGLEAHRGLDEALDVAEGDLVDKHVRPAAVPGVAPAPRGIGLRGRPS